MVVLAQAYLRNQPGAQPATWQQAAELMAELDPGRKWTDKRVEHRVRALRLRLAACGVAGIIQPEVGGSGDVLKHNLIKELIATNTITSKDLELIDDTRGPVTRLSVAVRPSQAVVDRIAALPRPPHPGLHWSVPERWIVKLRPLGHVPEHLVGPLGDALAAALDGAPAPECVLGPVTVRGSGQWLYAPVDGLDELSDDGVRGHRAPRPGDPPPALPSASWCSATGRVPAEVAGEPVDGTWRPSEVALVADRSAPGRPRLVDLTTLPLSP